MHLFLNLLVALVLPLGAMTPDDADDLIQYIDGLHDRGLHDMVASEALDFLEDYPSHAERNRVRYRLATALFELGRRDDALPHFRRLAQTNAFDYQAECALRFGQCALDAELLSEARGAFELTLSLDADYLKIPATYLLAEADFRDARFAQAEPRFLEVLRAEPNGSYAQDARSSLAWCAFRLGKHDVAIERAQALLERQPANELALEMRFLIGEANLEANRPDQARAAYHSVNTGAFADAALRGLGFAESARRDHAAAAAAFARMLEQFPDSRFADEARLQLGIQRLQAGDAQGAAAALADRTLGDTAETLYWRARADAALGRHEQALQQLDRALGKSPDEDLKPHIHTARGDALTALGRSNVAAGAYEQAGSMAALHAAAVTQLNAGKAAESLRLVTPLLSRADADAAVHLTYAEALFALERYEEARPAFQRARATKDPAQQRRVDSRLAWCAYLAEDHAAAATAFENLSKSAPTSPEGREALFMAGRSYRRHGNEQAAVNTWSRYVGLQPRGERRDEALMGLAELSKSPSDRRWLETLVADHADSPYAPGALLALAEADAEAGKTSAAQARYAQLIEQHPDDVGVPAARYGLAFCLLENGDAKQAGAALQPLTVQPHSKSTAAPVDPALRSAALELLVWCRHEQGDPQGAEAAWRQLAAQPDIEGDRISNSGRTVAAAWRAADRPDRALDLLDEISARPDVGAAALVEGAWIALDEGALDVAAERLDLARVQDKHSAAVAEACFFLAEALFAQGDDSRAVPYYRVAAEAQNSTLADEALYKQGFAHLRSDEPEPAAASFAALVERYPNSTLVGESLFLGGEAWYRMQRYEEAVAPLKRLIAEFPRHDVLPKARFRLGLSLAQLGRCEEAEGILTRLAQQSPDFPNLAEAELWRGRCLADQQRERAAQSAYERVIELDKGMLAAQARLGIGHMRLDAGETEDALSEFLKVALLYSHDEEVAEALFMAGMCLEDMGQAERARDRYLEVIDDHPDTAISTRARKRLSVM